MTNSFRYSCKKLLFQLIYCLDFLYPRIKIKTNELGKLVAGIKQIEVLGNKFSKTDGSYQSSKTIAPLEDTRYSLFAINTLEDLKQDILYYYGENSNLKPTTKIYQSIPQIDRTYEIISK